MNKLTLIALALITGTLAACGTQNTPEAPIIDTPRETIVIETTTPVEVEENTDEATETTEATDTISVNLEESILQREASKKLITNYYHRGTVDFSEVTLAVDEDGNWTSLDATVDMTTITYSEGKGAGVINHIKSADLFDVETYPTARLVSTSITRSDIIGYDVEAELTIKNQTNPVFISFIQEGDNTYTASFEIDRTQRGITYGSDNFFDNLGNNVINDTISYETTITLE